MSDSSSSPTPPGPAAPKKFASRPPRSGITILTQGLVFVAVAAFIAMASYRVLRSTPPAGHSVGAATADAIPWKTDLPAALLESKQTGKPVLVDFSASWCPPCQQMQQSSWPDARVRDAVRRGYIPVLLDADQPEARAPGSRYGIQFIPSILILDASGKVLRQGDFMTADQLVEFLH